MIEAVVATEANVAAVVRPSTNHQTPRQVEILLTTHPHQLLSPRECADGTGNLVTKAGSVFLIALISRTIWQSRSRETVRGGAGCERGHPLPIINSKKQFTLRSRRNLEAKMAYRWWSCFIHHPPHTRSTPSGSVGYATPSCKWVTHQVLWHQADANPPPRQKTFLPGHYS